MMKSTFSASPSLGLLALLVLYSAGVPAQDTVLLSGEALINALRGGGFNVYFRHAATDWSQGDDVRAAGDWISCDGSRVRQLSDGGRRTASEVGKAIQTLGIPVGRVRASPYCRTVETARLMALGPVETTTDIMNLRVANYFGGRAAVARRARSRLAVAPTQGTNIVLVGHGNVAREATDIYPGEGEGLVFRPSGSGGFDFVGRLAPDQWVRLAEALAGKEQNVSR